MAYPFANQEFMKRILTYLPCLLALLLSACGHSDSFRIDGELTDGSTINLRIIYYSDGAVVTGITASKEGKFVYEGHVSNPALIEIYDNDYRLFGRMVASPGEDLRVKLNPANPYIIEIKGNDTSREWGEFLNTNAELLNSNKIDARNDLVAKYVKDNPQSRVSELILATEFDASRPGGELLVDSLLNLIDPAVREKGFSVPFAMIVERVGARAAAEKVMPIPYRKQGNDTGIFKPSAKPYNLIVFSDDCSGRDTICKELRKLMATSPRSRFDVIELSMDIDTVVWNRSIKTDSATWSQGWVAGAISAQSVDKLGLPSIPYYIVSDSAGRQLWRGNSITEAAQQLKNGINR